MKKYRRISDGKIFTMKEKNNYMVTLTCDEDKLLEEIVRSDNLSKHFELIESEDDNVNHPKHYASECSLECIDVMMSVLNPEAVYHGCLMNCFKYLWRYKNKGKPEEDLAKAKWYLDRAKSIANDLVITSNWYIEEELLTKLTILYNTTVEEYGEK